MRISPLVEHSIRDGTHPFVIDLHRFAALIFDMDGVITDTARVHAAAWKQLFDEYLARDVPEGNVQRPFTDDDYRRYVDGSRSRDRSHRACEARCEDQAAAEAVAVAIRQGPEVGVHQRGLDTRASRTEWTRAGLPATPGAAQGEGIYGDSTRP